MEWTRAIVWAIIYELRDHWLLWLFAAGFVFFFLLVWGLVKTAAPDNPVDQAQNDEEQIAYLEALERKRAEDKKWAEYRRLMGLD